MLDLGESEMAKYPFLADSGKYLRDKGFAIGQFGWIQLSQNGRTTF